MREESVARMREFAAWLEAGRQEAVRNAAELLGRPVAEWDEWLAAHPEAATAHLLQALLTVASDDPRALGITEFVLRRAEDIPIPADAEPVRGVLRAHALEELSRQFHVRIHRNPLEALAITRMAIDLAGAFLTAPSIAAVYAWRDHGTALRTLARYDEALAAYDRAEQMAPLSERQDLVRANIVMARVAALQEAGRLEEAMPLLRDCQRVFATYGDARGRLFAAIGEGALLQRMGRPREACEMYVSILPLAADLGDADALATIHNNIGHAAVEHGDFALAESHLGAAVRQFTELALPLQVARSELARGRLMIRTGRINEGIEHLHHVREEFLRHQLVEEAGLCGLDIVEAHLERGAQIEAEAFARQIVREFTAARLNARAITALRYLSEAIEARKASQAAVRGVGHFIRALRANPEMEFVA